MQKPHSPWTFSDLTPEPILHAVEKATNLRFTGLVAPLPSYINRVYELQDMEGKRHIVKFYRPGRWTRPALEDEHRFLVDCHGAELPVVAPQYLHTGETLGETGGIFFALFPKRAGRELDISEDRDWEQLGRLIGRLHNVAAAGRAEHRICLHPDRSLDRDARTLLSGGMPAEMQNSFRTLVSRLQQNIRELFTGQPSIRLHGDLHRKNILHRPGEGLLLIDFDDMMTGPAIQDLWLLLPDRPTQCPREINLLMEGYQSFRKLPTGSMALVEGLRAMRQIYFLAWCQRQQKDARFAATFPEWGTGAFWRQELRDLEQQLHRTVSAETTRPSFHFIADL
ncbi:serine/threonine protein kinase [Desulfobotulus sp. H1]|uniref:Stress response kinase A n=1 Tax=Desulfobotulus pelophilus TaxID=2823377 RepID=A0ABT3N9Q2_9BACT|nr:serine/threonine protein kinase [Desulfobotulus pelophilus]MCW7754194.1 serine/threonine protein kinase [Desulfobotulus pelophilus]